MNRPENVLELRAVSKIYSTRPVLDRLDLNVPAGSVVGLLGKNGAGKTTLLRCALGLAKPQHGSVTILGEEAKPFARQFLENEKINRLIALAALVSLGD